MLFFFPQIEIWFLTAFPPVKTKLKYQHDQKEQDTRKLLRNTSVALIRLQLHKNLRIFVWIFSLGQEDLFHAPQYHAVSCSNFAGHEH